MRSLINQLRAEIDAWEINYALITPVDGEITLTQYWTNNQNVTAGNIVFNIVPTNQGEIIGKALLPTERSGKVRKGQKVNIRFSNYPDKEFGIVKGTVKNYEPAMTRNCLSCRKWKGRRILSLKIYLYWKGS